MLRGGAFLSEGAPACQATSNMLQRGNKRYTYFECVALLSVCVRAKNDVWTSCGP